MLRKDALLKSDAYRFFCAMEIFFAAMIVVDGRLNTIPLVRIQNQLLYLEWQ